MGAGQDDTAEIEYTRAFDFGLKAAKPRRRSTFQQRKAPKEAPITIFEDVLEEQELVVEQPRREIGGAMLMGRKAQKPVARRRESGVALDVWQQQGLNTAQPSVPERRPQPIAMDRESTLGRSTVLKKEPRRRTIFVPPDDTTMFTIHPGANTTDRLNDTFQLPNNYVQPTAPPPNSHSEGQNIHPAEKNVKRPRLSMAAAPKRVPLQSVAGQDLYNVTGMDEVGQNGGKENVPPGYLAELPISKTEEDEIKPLRPRSTLSSLHQATAASKARQSIVPREAAPLPRTASTTIARQQAAARRQSLRPDAPDHQIRQKHARFSLQIAEISPAHIEDEAESKTRQSQRPLQRKVPRLSHYPVLSEDLAQPELYEDNWLSHQEIALTEVINQLFRDAEPDTFDREAANSSLRERLIKIYHRQEVTGLYKRLQASLLYGALSRPPGSQSPPNPAFDIGLRKRFLGIWLESYDQDTLVAAAEVVFGRQIPKRSPASVCGPNSTLDPHTHRRSLIGFLETFLVEVADAEEPDLDRRDDSHPRWRKMVLRSLMLVRLLDQIKVTELSPCCLFKPTSAHKSSASILNALSSMLIPSTGDIARTLRHLNYEVSHVQDPLDEVKYRIDNIAVDLRDGILLTKLVEVLLFSPRKPRGAETTNDATITIRMPDLTILESAMYEDERSRSPRVLSQHLKMPCTGRAQKVYNVDLALSALRDHGRIEDSDMTSDDMVNGHRERTLSFLWSLVSAHGLECLVDFTQLLADTRRFNVESSDLPIACNSLSQLQQESLLKKWASAHCVGSGLRISNLTTAFADGRAYAAILESFAHTSPSGGSTSKVQNTLQSNLRAQLLSFGCSEAFIKQITTSSGTIPSRKTTISNLAFLAARLLPLAKRTNAATVIQRAFRHRRAKTIASQRIILMRLAHDCATVVGTQHRVTNAAVVLQRAWRRLLDVRITRLNDQVESFQRLARGWIVRRREQRKKFGQSARVMGGW